jgi:hypothetical protein
VSRLWLALRRLFHRGRLYKPATRGLMTDWEFMRGSYRRGEPFDPLNAIIEE